MNWISIKDKLPHRPATVLCLCGEDLYFREKVSFYNGEFYFTHLEWIETINYGTDNAEKRFKPIEKKLDDVKYWIYVSDIPKPQQTS
jgi:hypothetical protein